MLFIFLYILVLDIFNVGKKEHITIFIVVACRNKILILINEFKKKLIRFNFTCYCRIVIYDDEIDL